MMIGSTTTRPVWPLPWLLLASLLALLLYPTARLWPGLTRGVAPPEATAAIPDGPLVEVGGTTNFCIYAPDGYLDARQLKSFLKKAERQRARLIDYLEKDSNSGRATVRLHPGPGNPGSCSPCTIDLYGLEAGQNNLIHELTHCLVRAEEPLLEEGLAVLMEQRFGWGISSVTHGRSLTGQLYAQQREGAALLPLAPLRYNQDVWHTAPPAVTHLLYLETGSFMQYLIHAYGKEAVLGIFPSSSLRAIEGHTLDSLEREWRAFLVTGHLLQAVALLAGALLVLTFVHLTHGHSPVWCLPAGVALATFYVWSLYLAYSMLIPGAFGTAVAVDCIARRLSPRWRLYHTWLLGLAALGPLLLLPALAPFI